jgi:hypothetical protein
MRRIATALTVLLVCLLGLPATAHAAPDPLGGGAVLVNRIGNATQCTAAFAAVDGAGEWYLVTGRACGAALSTDVYSGGDNTLVGTVVAADPAYAIVHVTNTTDWELVSWIETGLGRVEITGSVETPVGGPVRLADPTFGLPGGTVIAKNETVVFPDGEVKGLTRTDICASPRAVAYITGNDAQGVPMGGSTFCTTAGTSWFAPITPILRARGLELLTS